MIKNLLLEALISEQVKSTYKGILSPNFGGKISIDFFHEFLFEDFITPYLENTKLKFVKHLFW